MEKISVAVRVRPPISSECSKGNQWKVVDNTISLCSQFGTPVSGQAYTFDHVFGAEVKNGTVYELHTRGVITSALRGFNGTVFAYGQTSSGKTYTMRGSKTDLGLIGLAVCEVFSDLLKIVNREFLIRVSYMEIYNEEINDLLSPDNTKLQIHENLEKGIFVAGLREEIVNSPEQVFELLEFGEAHRHVGQTNMNVYSSRSHTIFRMVIESKDKQAEPCAVDAVRVSVLNLVDLAGSERVAKTGAGGVRLREGTHINKSLMALGNVIKKLSDGAAKQGAHVPYRDSKLTRILQPALGGNAKTAIICTIAPDEVHIDETRGTLQFASRAKRIMTCAQVNEIITDAALLKRQQREIEDLRKKLKGFQSEVMEQEILRLRNDLLKYELEREKLSLELQEERKAQLEREQRIKEQELKIENLSSLVITSALDDSSNKENSNHMGKNLLINNFESRLVTFRRERHQVPVNFDQLSERSGEVELLSLKTNDLLMPPEFGNLADEDLWFSLNDGKPVVEPDFLFSTPSRWTSSVGSTKEIKISSVFNALTNSRDKSERYKSQLEEAWKENLELRNQLQEQSVFQKQLANELSELEKEVCTAKSMTQTMNEFQEYLATQKSEIHSAIMQADQLRNVHLQSLMEKVRELELELLQCKEENSELRMQYHSLHEQHHSCEVATKRVAEESISKDERLPNTANCKQSPLSAKETGAPFIFSECRVGRYRNKLPSPDGQLSNGGAALTSTCEVFGDSKRTLVFQMPEVDIWAGGMQKDYNIRPPDDNWHAKSGGQCSVCHIDEEELVKQRKICASGDFPPETEENNKANQRWPTGSNARDSKDHEALIETLLMSKEHIRGLERQIVLANLEKDRTRSLLKEHLHAHERSMVAMKLEKLKFAKELKSIMEAIAVQDSFVTSICRGIEEFEKGTDLEGPNFRRQIISN